MGRRYCIVPHIDNDMAVRNLMHEATSQQLAESAGLLRLYAIPVTHNQQRLACDILDKHGTVIDISKVTNEFFRDGYYNWHLKSCIEVDI